MFEMALRYWGKGLWQNCNHHWTVYIKLEFQHLAGGGLYKLTLSNGPQVMGNSFMSN